MTEVILSGTQKIAQGDAISINVYNQIQPVTGMIMEILEVDIRNLH